MFRSYVNIDVQLALTFSDKGGTWLVSYIIPGISQAFFMVKLRTAVVSLRAISQAVVTSMLFLLNRYAF